MAQQVDSKKVMIVAGEASGDLHGANLIKAARESAPGLSFFGVGGERMRQAGCEVLVPSESLAVMGVAEVIGRLPTIHRAYKKLCRILQDHPEDRPDLLVLIDYPGLNLKLAKVARQVGVKVLYFIAPKVWASRPGRLKAMARSIDQLAVIFPFEEKLFADAGIATTYVGNPLLDEFSSYKPDADGLKTLGLDSARPIVGLFPGSRGSEIRYCWPTLSETARQLKKECPELQFVVPLAPGLSADDLQQVADPETADLVYCRDNIYAIAGACRAVLAVSGTVTLQVALAGVPMTVMYKVSQLTYRLARRLVKIPYISLPNIVAGRKIVTEYLQHEASVPSLVGEVRRLLEEEDYRQNKLVELTELRAMLGQAGCSTRVAALLTGMMS